MGQASLAQAGRPVKNNMVKGLPPALGSSDGNFEVFLYLILADKVGQTPGSKTGIEWYVLGTGLTRYYASYCLTPSILHS
jgi:hypothetical protein